MRTSFKVTEEIGLLVLGRLIQAGLILVSLRLMTSILPPEEVGLQYLLLSVLLGFGLILLQPIATYANRNIHGWQSRGELKFQMGQLNLYFAVVSLVSTLLIYAAAWNFSGNSFFDKTVVPLFVGVYLYFNSWLNVLTAFYNILGYKRAFVIFNITSQLAGILLALFAVSFFWPQSVVWLSGLLAGQILVFIIALIFFRKIYVGEVRKKENNPQKLFSYETLQFCWPIAITTCGAWMTTQSYRLLVEHSDGVTVLAGIGVGAGIAMSISGVLETIATQYFYPRYYKVIHEADFGLRFSAWQNLWKHTTAVFIASFFLILALSHFAVRILVAPGFHHVVPYVFFGAAIELFRQLSGIANMASQGEYKTASSSFPYFSGALVLALFWVFREKAAFVAEYLLWGVIAASVSIYSGSVLVVRKLFAGSYRYDFKHVMKVLLWSSPLLIPAFTLSTESGLLILIVGAAVSGLWFLTVIYTLSIRKENFLNK